MKNTLPEARCTDGSAHYWKQLVHNVWWCKKCWAARWLPEHLAETMLYHTAVHKVGEETAYRNTLTTYPAEAAIIAKLEEIRLVRKAMPEEEQMLLSLIDHIVRNPPPEKDKNNHYRKKVKVWEMDILLSFELVYNPYKKVK